MTKPSDDHYYIRVRYADLSSVSSWTSGYVSLSCNRCVADVVLHNIICANIKFSTANVKFRLLWVECGILPGLNNKAAYSANFTWIANAPQQCNNKIHFYIPICTSYKKNQRSPNRWRECPESRVLGVSSTTCTYAGAREQYASR